MSNLTSLVTDQFSGSAVLVTGGCGFIGSHLTKALEAMGANVVIVDNLQAGKIDNLKGTKADINIADVRDADSISRILRRTLPSYIFHLAANASVPASVNDPVYDFEANASGTFVLLNAIREARDEVNIRKVVIASSGAVYGEPRSFPIRETDTLDPISPYGASKLCSEVEARIFHRVYQLPVCIARIFNCYGPRMARFVILDFLRKLQKDQSRLEILGSGRQVRDFTYVSDTVSGLLILSVAGMEGEAYNISSGTKYSVTELAQTMINAQGLNNITELCFTGESWVGDAQHWEVNIDKLSALGYVPAISLEQGIAYTSRWFDDSNSSA